ncbi:MAG: hypothetical protein JO254_04720 [Pseudolabrys sp.]|nr:hypothetical protein [Pseudolabrys sp.]
MSTQVSIGRLSTAQNVAVTTTSAASTAFGPQSYRILCVASAACNIRVGNAPVAVVTDTLLPASWPIVLDVTPGTQVAAIMASGTATLSVTELT